MASLRLSAVRFVVFADAVGFVVGVQVFAVLADDFGHVCQVISGYVLHRISDVLAYWHRAVIG